MKPADTSREARRVQMSVWRRMGKPATAELAIRMSEEARTIAMGGIRARHPDYTDDQVRHALFRMTLGDRLYRAAWPGRPLLEP